MFETVPSQPPTRSPHWYGVPVRIFLLTFIGTLLCFAFSLLFAIVGLSIFWMLHGVHPNMAVAYRKIALPSAFWGGVVVFVLSLVSEVRHYRQGKTLSAIEKMG